MFLIFAVVVLFHPMITTGQLQPAVNPAPVKPVTIQADNTILLQSSDMTLQGAGAIPGSSTISLMAPQDTRTIVVEQRR